MLTRAGGGAAANGRAKIHELPRHMRKDQVQAKAIGPGSARRKRGAGRGAGKSSRGRQMPSAADRRDAESEMKWNKFHAGWK